MLSMTGTRFSRFLRAATKKKYTHVSISLDRQFTQLYSFGRRNPYLPFIAGFVKEEPSDGVFAKFPTRCVVFEIPVTQEEYLEIRRIIDDFMSDYDHYRYNFIGLPLMALEIPLKRKWHFVCSQFVAYLLGKSGVVQFEKDLSLIRPDDFFSLEDKTKIYEGFLRDYIFYQAQLEEQMGPVPY